MPETETPQTAPGSRTFSQDRGGDALAVVGSAGALLIGGGLLVRRIFRWFRVVTGPGF